MNNGNVESQYCDLSATDARAKCMSSAVNAIAMMSGFAGALPAQTAINRVRAALADQVGGAELYHELATYAVLSHDIMATVQDCEEFDGAPGVYVYEVDEAFGEWWREFVLAFNDQPNDEQCKARLGALAWEFFKNMDGVPPMDAEETLCADIIEGLTGYREGKA